MTFWDHLDVLRGSIFRCLAAFVVASAALFCFKEFLFDDIILAPTRGDFFVYRWIGADVSLSLVNIEITAQFMTHVKVALIAALVVCAPYFLWEIWRFVLPALYENEKKAVRKAFLGASLLFYVGIAIGYCLVLPLMVQFFQGYSVSEAIPNCISLTSYISTVASTVLLFGLVFEFPMLSALLSGLHVINRGMLLRGWRYAVLSVVVLAAVITPSGDPFSLFVVSLPLMLLYGLCIAVCRKEEAEA